MDVIYSISMKTLSITLLLLMLATPAHAGEWFSWDKTNTQLHVPLTLLMIADLGQTLWIADNPDTHYERYNIVLDTSPSKGDTYRYFAASYALTTLAVYALPEKYSHALQGGIITLEVYMIENNHSLGIGVKF